MGKHGGNLVSNIFEKLFTYPKDSLPKRFELHLDIKEMDIIIQALFKLKNPNYKNIALKLRKNLEIKLYGSELIRTKNMEEI